jgi:predicted transcriptional regulator
MRSIFFKKSYFALPNEVIEKYRTREISAVDVTLFAALCSLRRYYNGVRASQRTIAVMCGNTKKTVAASVYRLYLAGLIADVITETVKHRKKYKMSIYVLKPLPVSGFFLVPRRIFGVSIPPKMFAMYLFMCRARSYEYGKTWNSYNDISEKLGYGKNQRSEVVALIGGLVERGLIKKTVRRIKKVFVDNIYRIIDFENSVIKKKRQSEKRPADTGTLSLKNNFSKTSKVFSSSVIIPQTYDCVKPQYMQLSLNIRLYFDVKGGGV